VIEKQGLVIKDQGGRASLGNFGGAGPRFARGCHGPTEVGPFRSWLHYVGWNDENSGFLRFAVE
jgi:hypothetical protein